MSDANRTPRRRGSPAEEEAEATASTTERCAALTRNEIDAGGEPEEEELEEVEASEEEGAPTSTESPGIILLTEEGGAAAAEAAEDPEGEAEAAAFLPSTQTLLPMATSSKPPLGVGVLSLELCSEEKLRNDGTVASDSGSPHLRTTHATAGKELESLRCASALLPTTNSRPFSPSGAPISDEKSGSAIRSDIAPSRCR